MELTELNLTDEQLESVTKYVQSETDKVRTKYAQELAKYKPTEKTEAEKALEEKEKALVERENAIKAKERTTTIMDKLQAKGLPTELANYINVSEDIDTDIDDIGSALNRYYLSHNYRPESHGNNKGITKEQFKQMSYMDRTKLYKDNPDLYKILSK